MNTNHFNRWTIHLAGYGVAFGLGFVLAWLVKLDSERLPPPESKIADHTPTVHHIKYPALGLQDKNKCAARAEFEELEAAASPRSEAVQQLARRWSANSADGPLHVGQIVAVADSLMKHWIYRDDPTGEDALQSAARSIQAGLRGDCEDFAATGAALIQALGGRVRVIKAWRGSEGHSWLEVNLGLGELDSSYTKGRHVCQEGPLTWLRVDWSCRGEICFEPDRSLVFDLSKKTCYPRP